MSQLFGPNCRRANLLALASAQRFYPIADDTEASATRETTAPPDPESLERAEA